jgi:hypothetical protein
MFRLARPKNQIWSRMLGVWKCQNSAQRAAAAAARAPQRTRGFVFFEGLAEASGKPLIKVASPRAARTRSHATADMV